MSTAMSTATTTPGLSTSGAKASSMPNAGRGTPTKGDSQRRRVLLGVGASLVIVVVAAIALRPISGTRGSAKRTPSEVSARTIEKQKAVAGLAYPQASAICPLSIKIVYDDVKDRTRMTLTWSALSATASGYRLSNATLRLNSEFVGKVRPADTGELSVQGVLTAVSIPEGGLAAGSPPAEFTVDGTVIEAKPATAGKSGYSSKAKSDGSHESLAFKVRTQDLITMASAKSLKWKAGVAECAVSSSQVADLREFVARMNPRP